MRARLDPHEAPLNATERGRLGVPGRWVRSLYRRSELCVVAPGDASVLGQRLSDAVAAGCVPVVLVGPGSYPVLPLQGPIPWEEFIFVVRLGSAGAARLALRRLLKMSASSIEQRRGALERWRPRLALPAAGASCGEGPDAGDLALRDFKDTVYPFFETETLFLDCVFTCLAASGSWNRLRCWRSSGRCSRSGGGSCRAGPWSSTPPAARGAVLRD